MLKATITILTEANLVSGKQQAFSEQANIRHS